MKAVVYEEFGSAEWDLVSNIYRVDLK